MFREEERASKINASIEIIRRICLKNAPILKVLENQNDKHFE